MAIMVTKGSGEQVPFDGERLVQSLTAAGAGSDITFAILRKIEEKLYDGISTKEIYKDAYRMLRSYEAGVAGRYKLKKAILELGPSGYPFERFVGMLFNHIGYKTKVGTIIRGHCTDYEIDVIAEKDGRYIMAECKFHSAFTRKCDLQVPLYVQARYLDIKKANHIREEKFYESWIVTNTQFTSKALEYGLCSGQHLVSWNFPKNGSLKQRIDLSGLHPVTCLSSLNKTEKNALLQKDIVMVSDMLKSPNVLENIIRNDRKTDRILSEAKSLLSTDHINQHHNEQ